MGISFFTMEILEPVLLAKSQDKPSCLPSAERYDGTRGKELFVQPLVLTAPWSIRHVAWVVSLFSTAGVVCGRCGLQQK